MRTIEELKAIIRSKVAKGIAVFFIAGCIIGMATCSPKSGDIKSKTERLEELNKEYNRLINNKTDGGAYAKALNVLEKINRLQCEITLLKPYWKGKPYEKIMNDLATLYNLGEYDDIINPSDSKSKAILRAYPRDNKPVDFKRTRWNMEEAAKIKKILFKRFNFEPKVDEYSTMTWTSKKYDIEVGPTASGDILLVITTNE